MKWQQGGWMVWLLRGLVVVAACLMIISFSMPWWVVDLYVPEAYIPPDAIRIYGYGMQHSLVELRSYVISDETPVYLTGLAWAYIIAGAGLAVGSVFIVRRWSRWLLGGVGLSYIVYAALAIFVVVANRAGDFNIALRGISGSSFWEGAEVYVGYNASLETGYYLACASGLLLIISAFFYNGVLKKNKKLSPEVSS
jgi:hypothetical protein